MVSLITITLTSLFRSDDDDNWKKREASLPIYKSYNSALRFFSRQEFLRSSWLCVIKIPAVPAPQNYNKTVSIYPSTGVADVMLPLFLAYLPVGDVYGAYHHFPVVALSIHIPTQPCRWSFSQQKMTILLNIAILSLLLLPSWKLYE